jgi:hypothetical protein
MEFLVATPIRLGTMALITTDRITGDEIAEFDHLSKARSQTHPAIEQTSITTRTNRSRSAGAVNVR